jgi:molecular chaperone HscA
VGAREQSTGVEASVAVKPSYGVSNTQVVQMLEDAYGKADSDMQVRMLREAQVDARRLLDATQAALAQDGEALLSPTERTAIAQAIYGLAEIIETSGPDTVARRPFSLCAKYGALRVSAT